MGGLFGKIVSFDMKHAFMDPDGLAQSSTYYAHRDGEEPEQIPLSIVVSEAVQTSHTKFDKNSPQTRRPQVWISQDKVPDIKIDLDQVMVKTRADVAERLRTIRKIIAQKHGRWIVEIS